jgi:hypothetical protein
MDHKVVRMAFSERQENGEVTLDQSRENYRFCRVSFESGGHRLTVDLRVDRTYVRPTTARPERLS